jgi:hypothetical protein
MNKISNYVSVKDTLEALPGSAYLDVIFEVARTALADANLFDRLADEMDLSDEALHEIRDGLETYMNR